MTTRKNKMLTLTEKEKMFWEYKNSTSSMSEISRKYGASNKVLRLLVKKYNAGESFERKAGGPENTVGRPKKNFANETDELEYRRMVMAIEGKLRTLKKLKNQTNFD